MKLHRRILTAALFVFAFAASTKADDFVVKAQGKVDAPAGVVITGTDRPQIFSHEVYGPTILATTTKSLPAGKYTLELDVCEFDLSGPNQRVMSVFADQTLLSPRLDIFADAGGSAVAMTKSYAFDHAPGKVAIKLVGIEGDAKFDAIRIKDASGMVVAQVDAQHASISRVSGFSRPFRVLRPDELVIFNADHAAVGAYTSLVYGLDFPHAGFSHRTGGVSSEGLVIGIVADNRLKLMPFAQGPSIDSKFIHRTILACTDSWSTPGLSWTHYTPSWQMMDIATASDQEKRRFTLPATWIEFTLDNTAGRSPRTLVFGLPGNMQETQFAGGQFVGLTSDTNIFAVDKGVCDVMSAADAAKLDASLNGPLLAITAPAGQTKRLRVIVASYDDKPSSGAYVGKFYYTTLFKSPDEVISYAAQTFDRAKARCEALDHVLTSSGLNPYRQFLAAHSLHSYQYNTMLLADATGAPTFCENEGGYSYINTFDLTADHAFYQCIMHPWTLRNILDNFVTHYSYRPPILNPVTLTACGQGLSFTHDMGIGTKFWPDGHAKYDNDMAAEELLNWILCAGLYWKKSGDTAWLHSRASTLVDCLDSLTTRDNPDPAKRDGIIHFVSRPADYVNRPADKKEEITTYDALDASLKQVRENLYIAVKCWAAYVALEAMFQELGDSSHAAIAHGQALRAAATIAAHWDAQNKFLPAIFDGTSQSRIIPAVEALAFPQQMGLTEAVSMHGPYANLMHVLHDHLDSILKPGVCLDAVTGGWKLSSTSKCTWQSKVYLSQFVAEKILGLGGDRISGRVDAVHASFEVLGTPDNCWSDQLSSDSGRCVGSSHYPRGATTALWWLTQETAKN